MTNSVTYREQLLSLIPAEAVAAYTTIGGIAQTSIQNRFDILYIAIVVLALLLPFYLWFAAGTRNKLHIFIITISFCIWAINIDPPFAKSAQYEHWPASVILILWTFAVPIFGRKGRWMHAKP